MKKILSLFVTAALFFGIIAPISASAASCTLETISDVMQGQSVEIRGSSSGENYYVTLYLKDADGIVRMVDLISPVDGSFSKTIRIPYTWPAGEYTAIAGFGSTTDIETFNVTSIGEYVGIDDIYFETDQYSKFVLPDEVTIKYEKADVVWTTPTYEWDNELNIYVAGTYTATGKIIDVNGVERTFDVTVEVRPVGIVNFITEPSVYEFEVGEAISLPDYVEVSLSNRRTAFVPVTWTPDPAGVATDEEKTVEFTGSVPEFDPTLSMSARIVAVSDDIPRAGLALWADADYRSVSLNADGEVTQWADKSGKGNDFVPISSDNAPTVRENAVNKHMSLVFDDAGLTTEGLDAYEGDSTIFVVYKANSANDGSIISSSESGVVSGDIDIQQSGGQILALSNSGVGSRESTVLNSSIDRNDFHVVGIRVTQTDEDGEWNGSVIDTYYDGTAVNEAYTATDEASGFNTHNGYTIGTRSLQSGRFTDMEVAEVIIYQKNMSDSQIQRVRNYLNDKYLIDSRYSISVLAAVSGNSLATRSNITNDTSSDLESSLLLQTFASDGIIFDSFMQEVPLISAGRAVRIAGSIEWPDAQAELPETKAILFDSWENLAPLAASDYEDYISKQASDEKAVISSVEVLNSTVTVTGTLPSGAGKLAAVVVLDSEDYSDAENIYNAGTAVTDETGKFVYTFTLSDTDKSGEIFNSELYAYAGGEASSKSSVGRFGYAGAELREAAFELLKSADENEIADMLEPTSEYRNALNSMGLSLELYDALDESGKDDYVGKLSEAAKDITESGAEGIELLAEAMSSAYPIMELNAAATEEDIMDILNEYSDELGFVSAGEEQDAFLAAYLLNNKPFSSMDDYEAQRELSSVFYSINNASFASLTDLLTNNRELIEDASEYSYYIGLSTSNKQEVNKYIITAISRDTLYTAERLCELLDDAVAEYRDDSNNNNGNGGGGSSRPSGGNGGSGIGSIEIEDITQNNTNNNNNGDNPSTQNTFTDLGSVPWAEEAILNLKDKNIISGKTETEFYPQDNVTREEFVKMLVVMYGADINESEECAFTDCDSSMWYYPYVTAAAREGIVYGVTETEFGIGQRITRAQMAVMCERVINSLGITLENNNEAEDFADYDLIPDYAKESVAAMQKAGIIHGKDGGVFDPLGYATRAEAAVIINAVSELI